jgi:hypothetical protein
MPASGDCSLPGIRSVSTCDGRGYRHSGTTPDCVHQDSFRVSGHESCHGLLRVRSLRLTHHTLTSARRSSSAAHDIRRRQRPSDPLVDTPNSMPGCRNHDPIDTLLANATDETTAVMIYKSHLPMRCFSMPIDPFINY